MYTVCGSSFSKSLLFWGGVSQTGPPKSSFFVNEDPKTVFINESGFYSIIFASQKEEAKKFKRQVTSIVLPSIRKTGSYNIIDNYIEEDLDKYYNKDCVYILHIKDNIYKYGYTSHIHKRLQSHKTNFKYNKIIKIYELCNMNATISLENKIKALTKSLNINRIYNTHIEIFEVDNNNLQNIINKIDELSLNIIEDKNIIEDNKLIIDKDIIIEKEKTKQIEEKTKQLEIEGKTKQLEIEIEGKTKQLEIEGKTKQLELENENLKIKLEILKLSK